MDTIFGKKIESTRKFTEEGEQVPVSKLMLLPMVVTQVKTEEKDGYTAIQLGIGEKKLSRIGKVQKGHLKKAGVKGAFLHFREVRVDDVSEFKPGQEVSPAEVLKAGDLINVIGTGKGKGFAGVMKRWNFAGGPRTHGQSDRQRAPGSIGQGTTPGRVFKGKKMPGRMGGGRVTVRNLVVLGFDEEKGVLLIKGLVPGARNGLVAVKKIGKSKRFSPLMKGKRIIATESIKKEVVKPSKKEEKKEEKGEAGSDQGKEVKDGENKSEEKKE